MDFAAATNVARLTGLGDDRLLLAGGEPSALGTRLPDGTSDLTFKVGSVEPPGEVREAKPDPAGRLLVWGGFTSINGTPVGSLVHLSPTGALGPTFQTTLGRVEDLVVMSHGGVVASTRTVGPEPLTDTLRLIRLDAQGQPLPQFQVHTQVVSSWRGHTSPCTTV